MSNEGNIFHSGFFARIIRDALCTLPDANGERQPFALEQQVQAVVEYAETGAPIVAQSNTAIKPSTSTPDTSAPQDSFLPDAALRAYRADNATHTAAKPSSFADQQSSVSETSVAQSADKIAAHFPRSHFPRNHHAMAQQQAVKKIPLAISARAARSSRDHPLAPTVQHAESAPAPVQRVDATAPAAGAVAEVIISQPELTRVAITGADSNRLRLQDASLVKAEPAPMLAVHMPGRLVPERALPPGLRIGSVTLRVLDAAPELAVPSRTSKPVTASNAVDPIASAESRHFLRTL